MTRRPILSARSANHQIGYIEGRKAFDMFGNACADYEEGTGLLRDTKNDELLGYISLRNAFVAAKLGAEKSIFRTEGVGALQVTFTDHASGAAAQMDISVQRPSTKTAPADAGAGAVDDEHEPDPAGQRGTNGGLPVVDPNWGLGEPESLNRAESQRASGREDRAARSRRLHQRCGCSR
jgi:hypothetical protein